MNPITICPSTLAEGYDSYSPIAIKHLFDGRQVSPFLDYTPIDDDNNSAAQEEFLHNQERISLSGVQPKYSMIVRNGKLALTQKGEQGHYILKPKLSDFRNRIYSSANENLTKSRHRYSNRNRCKQTAFSKEENRHYQNGSMSSRRHKAQKRRFRIARRTDYAKRR